MASSPQSEDTPPDQEIHLRLEGDTWVAEDVETGVASQGSTREAALENLDEAVALYNGEVGRQPTDDELRELGIDPDENRTGDSTPPDVLD